MEPKPDQPRHVLPPIPTKARIFSSPLHDDVSPPDRIVTFSDGVFAIAITLLALDLVPNTTENVHGAQLTAMILANWPPVLSFAISFWLIGSLWMAHMRAFRWIERCDSLLILLNMMLLMLVTFLPYPTAVLGDHGPETPAVVFYALTITAVGGVNTVLWLHALSAKLVRADIPREVAHGAVVRSLAPTLLFLASAGVALFDPLGAMLMWGLMPVLRDVGKAVVVARHGRRRG